MIYSCEIINSLLNKFVKMKRSISTSCQKCKKIFNNYNTYIGTCPQCLFQSSKSFVNNKYKSSEHYFIQFKEQTNQSLPVEIIVKKNAQQAGSIKKQQLKKGDEFVKKQMEIKQQKSSQQLSTFGQIKKLKEQLKKMNKIQEQNLQQIKKLRQTISFNKQEYQKVVELKDSKIEQLASKIKQLQCQLASKQLQIEELQEQFKVIEHVQSKSNAAHNFISSFSLMSVIDQQMIELSNNIYEEECQNCQLLRQKIRNLIENVDVGKEEEQLRERLKKRISNLQADKLKLSVLLNQQQNDNFNLNQEILSMKKKLKKYENMP